ncbi:hypothetical protein GCM10027440_33090 [Nocardiopsis coralliicola]
MFCASDQRKGGSGGEDGQTARLAGRVSAGRVAESGDKCQEIGHYNGVLNTPSRQGASSSLRTLHGEPIPHHADLHKYEVTQCRGVRFPRTRLFCGLVGEKAATAAAGCPTLGDVMQE